MRIFYILTSFNFFDIVEEGDQVMFSGLKAWMTSLEEGKRPLCNASTGTEVEVIFVYVFNVTIM